MVADTLSADSVLRSGHCLPLFEPAMNDDASTRVSPFRYTPNLLTLARICLAPFLVAAILDDHYALSFCLFVAAGLTDALDGTAARLLKQRTVLGQYLDPVADKLLLSTLFLVLMHKGLIPAHVTVLVFGRDVGILLVAAILYAAAGRREFSPSLFGKANTIAQGSAVAAAPRDCITHGSRCGGWAHRLQTAPAQNKSDSGKPSEVVRDVLRFDGFFDLHVPKLFGVKDLATFQAFDIFNIIVPRDNSYFRVFTDCRHLWW